MAPHPGYRALTGAGCALAAAALALAVGSPTGLDGPLLDLTVKTRSILAARDEPPERSPVAVIAVDARSLEAPELAPFPRTLLAPAWAAVLDGVLGAGARGVGFDLLFSYSGNRFAPGFDAPFLRALGAHRERIVLARSATTLPAPPFLAALQNDEEALGLVELDGRPRREVPAGAGQLRDGGRGRAARARERAPAPGRRPRHASGGRAGAPPPPRAHPDLRADRRAPLRAGRGRGAALRVRRPDRPGGLDPPRGGPEALLGPPPARTGRRRAAAPSLRAPAARRLRAGGAHGPWGLSPRGGDRGGRDRPGDAAGAGCDRRRTLRGRRGDRVGRRPRPVAVGRGERGPGDGGAARRPRHRIPRRRCLDPHRAAPGCARDGPHRGLRRALPRRGARPPADPARLLALPLAGDRGPAGPRSRRAPARRGAARGDRHVRGPVGLHGPVRHGRARGPHGPRQPVPRLHRRAGGGDGRLRSTSSSGTPSWRSGARRSATRSTPRTRSGRGWRRRRASGGNARRPRPGASGASR